MNTTKLCMNMNGKHVKNCSDISLYVNSKAHSLITLSQSYVVDYFFPYQSLAFPKNVPKAKV